MRSAITFVARLVLAEGMVGMIDAVAGSGHHAGASASTSVTVWVMATVGASMALTLQ
jgi:hypothetical protein